MDAQIHAQRSRTASSKNNPKQSMTERRKIVTHESVHYTIDEDIDVFQHSYSALHLSLP